MDEAVSTLAQHMGVENFRPGRQILRDKRRWRIGEINVTHAWYSLILPSFHDRAVLAVARTADTEFRGEVFPAFFRAGIAIVSMDTSALKQAVVVEIESDPLPSAVSDFDLLASDHHISLDGIGYELHVDSTTFQNSLKFSNPMVACLRRIEDALFLLAYEIATLSGESIVLEYVRMWRSYLTDSGRTTRNGHNADECLAKVKRLLELLPALEIVREERSSLAVRLLLSVQSQRSLALLAHITRAANVQLSVEIDWEWEGASDDSDSLWYKIYLSVVPKIAPGITGEFTELQMFGGHLAGCLKRSGFLDVDEANRLLVAWNFSV